MLRRTTSRRNPRETVSRRLVNLRVKLQRIAVRKCSSRKGVLQDNPSTQVSKAHKTQGGETPPGAPALGVSGLEG